jgi:hypothetical protein
MLSCLIFKIQGRARNSEFGSRSIWPSKFSLTFRKSRFDESLLIVKSMCERSG